MSRCATNKEAWELLFEKYKNPETLAKANINEVKEIIKPIGMVNNKSKNIIEIANIIHNQYNDIVPDDKELLTKLPGVGNKTANVVLAEGFKVAELPVDTHINRIAKRLKIANIEDDVITVEKKLKKQIEPEM